MLGPSANGGERLPGLGREHVLDPPDPAAHQLALLLDRDVEHALVVVAVVADLVAPPRRDLSAGVRVLVDHLAGDHERRRDLVAVQQLVDPRQRGAHVVVASRHRAGRRRLNVPDHNVSASKSTDSVTAHR